MQLARFSRQCHKWLTSRRSSRSPARASAGGFTLIELLVVLSLVMIVSSIALTQYRNSVLTAKEAALKSDLWLMRDAIDQYYADKGRYPESIDGLVSAKYLRAIPKDPITNATDTWESVTAESEPGSVGVTAGISDVKSGSQDVAIDGSRYAEW